MKLNKSYIITTNNFKVNDIDVDLDYKETKFNNYSYDKNSLSVKQSLLKNFESNIGLNGSKYLNLDVTTLKNNNSIINYVFDDNSYLSSNINLNIKHDSNIIICFRSNKKSFLNIRLNVESEKDIKSNISIVTLTGDNSTNLVSINNRSNDNTNTIINYVDLLGELRISNLYSDLCGINSNFEFNTIYLGYKNERIDMNYYVKNNNINTVSNMSFEGAIKDNSTKTIRDTIDFIDGCKNSKGEENENCILLSENAISKSMPILLCHEEAVEGAHGMSSGTIDKNKLFYLTSRGLSEEDAKKLIIKSNFKKVLDNIFDEEIKNEINDIINRKIDD